MDLVHIDSEKGNNTVDYGMDLSEYYLNVEWDILSVPAERHIKYYPCCPEPYPDIYFNMVIRRKPLFYIVNLIIPCVGIFYLSILVFYLPAQSKQKTALVIAILVSQTLYFTLIIEVIFHISLIKNLLHFLLRVEYYLCHSLKSNWKIDHFFLSNLDHFQ